MHYIITASLCLLLNKLAVHERPRSFKKNVTVFKTKRGDVLKKRREIFGVGRKWGGATFTTTNFALIFSDLVAWCWICRWFWQITRGYMFFILLLGNQQIYLFICSAKRK